MRSVAKGNFIKGKGALKHALDHVRYLQTRPGADRDCAAGRRRLFIDAKRNNITGYEIDKRLKELDESKVLMHRIALSPGLEGVDMDAYARFIFKELEHKKGQALEFYAIKHSNTEHTHSHAILIGQTKDNKEIRLTRAHYKLIRDAGNLYLEKFHHYERYLDKDLSNTIDKGFRHDLGDNRFESLLVDLAPFPRSEESEKLRLEQQTQARMFAIAALPDNERIVRGGKLYTMYSSIDELLELERQLRASELEWLPEEQYRKFWSWIGNKKEHGDDYYERTAENDRIFRDFHDTLKESLTADYSPPKSFNQYLFESRGRLLDWHQIHTINLEKNQVEKELDLLNQDENSDPIRKQKLQEQLIWLNELSAEQTQVTKDDSRIVTLESLEDISKSMNTRMPKARHFDESVKISDIDETAWRKVYGDLPLYHYYEASVSERTAIHKRIESELSKNQNSISRDQNKTQMDLSKDFRSDQTEVLWVGQHENLNRSKESFLEVGRQPDLDRDSSFAHKELAPFDELDSDFDLEKSIENDWNLDQKIRGQEADINAIIFGTQPPLNLSVYEKSAAELNLDTWRSIAFDTELKHQSEQRHQISVDHIFGTLSSELQAVIERSCGAYQQQEFDQLKQQMTEEKARSSDDTEHSR